MVFGALQLHRKQKKSPKFFSIRKTRVKKGVFFHTFEMNSQTGGVFWVFLRNVSYFFAKPAKI